MAGWALGWDDMARGNESRVILIWNPLSYAGFSRRQRFDEGEAQIRLVDSRFR